MADEEGAAMQPLRVAIDMCGCRFEAEGSGSMVTLHISEFWKQFARLREGAPQVVAAAMKPSSMDQH